jgi:hypothetical protein
LIEFSLSDWEYLALLLALVSRGNERQANVPMFEAPNLSRGIVHNGFGLGEGGDFHYKC